jgi:hypothetical protein
MCTVATNVQAMCKYCGRVSEYGSNTHFQTFLQLYYSTRAGFLGVSPATSRYIMCSKFINHPVGDTESVVN